MLKILDNKKSLLGVVLITLVEVLTNTGVISSGMYEWMLPVAQGVLGVGLVDKVKKFTDVKGKGK